MSGLRILDWPRRAREAPKNAAVIALLGALFVTAIVGRQWWHVRGWPTESARAQQMVRTGHLQHCGRYDNEDVYAITWVSTDPPGGLPATFTSQEGCDAPQLGDVVTVVRVVNDDGGVHVWVDPATSGRDVAITFGAACGVVFVVAWVMFMCRIWWRRWRGHDDRPRHVADAAADVDAAEASDTVHETLSPLAKLFSRRRPH